MPQSLCRFGAVYLPIAATQSMAGGGSLNAGGDGAGQQGGGGWRNGELQSRAALSSSPPAVSISLTFLRSHYMQISKLLHV